MWVVNGRKRTHDEMEGYAAAMARFSLQFGDYDDATFWLSIASSAQLQARAERIAVARLASVA